MDYMIYVVSGVVVIGGIYCIITYNRLVNLRINVDRQASHVEVHLKKKFDLIPAIVECVKGYAKHEKGTLEEVTHLRSQWAESKTKDEKIKNANMLEAALSKLLIVQENYPQLKADRSFIRLQNEITHVENELAHERKVFNKRVSWYNVKLQEFPSVLVAKALGFQEREFFTFGKGSMDIE